MAGSKPTTEYIRGRAANPDCVKNVLPPSNTPANRQAVSRLSFSGGENFEWNYDRYAKNIALSALPNHTFFLDTCFLVKEEVPVAFWKTLRQFNICIVPLIAYELEPRMDSTERNVDIFHELSAAKVNSTPGIQFLPNLDLASECDKGAMHYIRLLALRKQIFEIAAQQHKFDFGTDPSPEELRRFVQSLVSDRGMTLAKKGQTDSTKPNFVADESLLVRAFLYALTHGCDVTILTRDKDLLEQFYKFQYLLDTHYRSYLIAQHFVKQPLNFEECPIQTQTEGLPFHRYRPLRIPCGVDERVLPADYRFANIHVDYIGEEKGRSLLSTYRFSADMEMLEVFRIKGRTNGLNTDCIPGWNLHRYFIPNTNVDQGPFCVIAEDKFVPQGEARFANLDTEIVLKRCERSSGHVIVDSEPSRGTEWKTNVGIQLSQFECPRITPCYAPDPLKMTLTSLKIAIDLQPYWTRFRATTGFANTMSPELIEILYKTKGEGIPPDARSWLSKLYMPPEHEVKKVFDYYLALLAHRKLFGKVCELELINEGITRPSRKQIQQRVVKYRSPKAWHRIEAFMNDERLDVFQDDRLAVDTLLSAIYTGEDTVILTDSRCFVEQCFTLISLMGGHYRAWCLGSHLANKINHLETGVGDLKNGFKGNVNFINLPLETVQESMPKSCFPIRVQVWLIEDRKSEGLTLYPLGFSVEMAMRQMFECKLKNEFRSTDQVSNRNLYFQYTRDGYVTKGTCIMGEDLMVPIGSKAFPADSRLDIDLTAVPGMDLVLPSNVDSSFPFPWSEKAQASSFLEDRKRKLSKIKHNKR